MRVMLPHLDYEERLQILGIPTLHKFLLDMSERQYDEIAGDVSHPNPKAKPLIFVEHTIYKLKGQKHLSFLNHFSSFSYYDRHNQ